MIQRPLKSQRVTFPPARAGIFQLLLLPEEPLEGEDAQKSTRTVLPWAVHEPAALPQLFCAGIHFNYRNSRDAATPMTHGKLVNHHHGTGEGTTAGHPGQQGDAAQPDCTPNPEKFHSWHQGSTFPSPPPPSSSWSIHTSPLPNPLSQPCISKVPKSPPAPGAPLGLDGADTNQEEMTVI